MTNPESSWRPEQSRQFTHHEQTLRGDIRYGVSRQNILNVLGEFLQQPRRIADIGGGTGSDARWFAGLPAGHDVYLFEPDKKSASEAVKGNERRVQIINGDAKTALEYYGPESFDLVVSHGVLMYMADAAAGLRDLTALTKPGGYLSIMNAGRFGKIERYTRRGDQKGVDRLRLDGQYVNDIGAKAHAFLPDEMQKLINQAGLETIDWFGIRIGAEDANVPLEEVPVFHRNRILSHQQRLSQDPTHRPRGQMLQFIVHKP